MRRAAGERAGGDERAGEWDEQGIDGVREVRGVMRVPPGSCVAIEDRALIGLDHAPVSSFGDVDRLL